MHVLWTTLTQNPSYAPGRRDPLAIFAYGDLLAIPRAPAPPAIARTPPLSSSSRRGVRAGRGQGVLVPAGSLLRRVLVPAESPRRSEESAPGSLCPSRCSPSPRRRCRSPSPRPRHYGGGRTALLFLSHPSARCRSRRVVPVSGRRPATSPVQRADH